MRGADHPGTFGGETRGPADMLESLRSSSHAPYVSREAMPTAFRRPVDQCARQFRRQLSRVMHCVIRRPAAMGRAAKWSPTAKASPSVRRTGRPSSGSGKAKQCHPSKLVELLLGRMVVVARRGALNP